MENRRAIIISIVCFTIAIILISGYVSVRRAEMTDGFGEEVNVVVANTKEPIPEFTVIRPGMVKTITVFKNFRQPSATDNIADIIGKSAYTEIYPGEQITLTKLVTHESKPVLDRQVEKSFRAITVSIAAHTGVGKLIRPGDRVDIMVVVNYDMKGTTHFEVKTALQNVLVLATGKNIQNGVPTRVRREVMDYLEEKFSKKKRKDWGGGSRERLATNRPVDDYATLTLQLSPEDAKKLLFVSHTYGDNRLYYTLRNSADSEVAQIDTTLLDDVLGPDSDYGRSFRKPVRISPPKPKYYDSKGGKAIPVF